VSSFVLTNCTVYVAGHDMTTDSNQLTLGMEVDEQENTTFGGGGWRSRLGGLRSASLGLEGYWQAGAGSIDADTYSTLGTRDEVVTVTPAGTEAQTAYMFQGTKFTYEMFGGVGEVAPFSLEVQGSEGASGLVRGQLAKAKGTVSATGALGSVVNLGAPTSTQYVYAVLHVFSAGTTITVQVQSDDSSGMASPTTRGTIGPITAAGGTWMTRVAGPFAGETHWRMNVSAITGSFSVAGAIAVQ